MFDKVLGRGNPNAKLAIFGEAPGDDEFRLGEPFRGPSGRLLETILGHNQILSDNCWVDNVVQTKPRGRNPSFEEIKLAIPNLRARLRNLPNVNCVLAVGNVALQALSVFKYNGITKYRGSILPARLVGKKMVPIVHPAFIMKDGYREFRYVHVSIADIARAWDEAQTSSLQLPKRNHRILYNFDEAIAALRTLKDFDYWAFDVETSLPCLGFAGSPNESFTIPFASELFPHIWPARQRDYLIQELKAVFTKDAKIIAQNGFFDKRVLWKDYGIDPLSWGFHADTMVMHQLLYNELPHALEFICSIYTREPFYKDEGRQWKRGRDPEGPYFTYNGKDCCVTLESFLGMEQELLDCNQHQYFYDVLMPALEILTRMHVNGVKVDVGEILAIKKELKREITISRIKTIQSLGFEVNPRSPLEMESFLNAIGVKEKDIIRSAKTHKVTTKKDYLDVLFSKYPREEIHELIKMRGNQHLLSGFTQLELDSDGRFRAVFKIGPKSGRLACSGDEKGPQLQNIPKKLRKMFVAPPGRTLVAGDLEQADTRCLAYGVPEPGLIELFESGDPDVHSQVCSQIFGIPRELIDKHGIYSEKRKTSKEVGHGSNYGMGPRKLVQTCRKSGIIIAERDARAFQEAYFIRFVNIKSKYHPEIQHQIRSTRTLVDLNGRRHTFLGFIDDTVFREAYSRIPQATVAGYMLIGMIELQKKFDESEWKNPPLILIQVHDELVVECDQTDDILVANMMREAFSIPLFAHGREFQIPMELSVGEKWGRLNEVSSTLLKSATDIGSGKALEEENMEAILGKGKSTMPIP